MYSYNSYSGKRTARTISLVSGLLFWIFSFVYLSVSFQYLLSMTEDFSLFVYNIPFFLEKVSQPGGVLLYLACFFTQFLHYPWLGALIITALLHLIQWFTSRLFSLNDKYIILSYIPSFLLLIIITNVGRSFYLMTHVEYIFTYVLGIFFLLLFYFFFQKIENPRISFITLCWLFPLLFFGLSGSIAAYFFGFLFLCSIFSINYQQKSLTYLTCAGLYLLSFLVAKLFLYPNSMSSQILFGIHPAIPNGQSGENQLPHLLLLFFFIFAAIKQRFFPSGNRIKSYARWTYTNLICLLVICSVTVAMANTNDNFRYEMAIDRYIQKRDFKHALKVGKNASHPTREMTVLHNFALELSGKSGEEMFEYAQDYKTDGLFLDYCKDTLSYPEGAMIYSYLGAKYIASEWADNDYLQKEHSYRMLKNYALIATINGHLNVTKNAAGILENTLYHRDLAQKFHEFSDGKLISKDSVLGDIQKRSSDKYFAFPSKGNYTKFICDFYRLNIDNKVAYDYYMMSALLNKNLPKFAWGIKLYKLHYKNQLPKHYAEAVALYNYLNNESLYVNQTTQQKFNDFLKLKKEQKNPATEKNIMRRKYGDTYWWYYMYK